MVFRNINYSPQWLGIWYDMILRNNRPKTIKTMKKEKLNFIVSLFIFLKLRKTIKTILFQYIYVRCTCSPPPPFSSNLITLANPQYFRFINYSNRKRPWPHTANRIGLPTRNNLNLLVLKTRGIQRSNTCASSVLALHAPILVLYVWKYVFITDYVYTITARHAHVSGFDTAKHTIGNRVWTGQPTLLKASVCLHLK